MLFRNTLSLTLLGLLLSLLSSAYAGEFKTFGDYAIHYNTINTDILQPEVARTHKLERSKNRALLNISIRKGATDKQLQDKAAPAKVTATATNLNGQLKTLDMREVKEGDAIYYIGTFAITNEETLDFNVSVDPENKGKAYEIKFRQQFFINEGAK